MNPLKALRGQLAKLQRLAQPYFLPVDDTRGWQFLVLVALAALAIAGIGIGNGVGSYLEARRGSIATLKILGASSADIARIFLLQLAAASALASLQQWVVGLPFLVQLVAIMFLTDLVQYWVHRAFHRVPWLWNFHAVHHSAQSMDWMAGARMHFLEILMLRTLTVIPMFALGFAPVTVNAYILLVYLYSTFIHANLGWRLPVIDQLLVTPRFHHWHHGIEKEAIDVNFAIHFPLFDRLFGTYYLPKDQWPSGYGIEGHPVPRGYWAQLLYPFRRK